MSEAQRAPACWDFAQADLEGGAGVSKEGECYVACPLQVADYPLYDTPAGVQSPAEKSLLHRMD